MLGFVTAVIALIIFNWVNSYFRTGIKVRLNKKEYKITYFKILNLSIANGVFLGVLFFVDTFLRFLDSLQLILGSIVEGFVMTFITILICLFIYNFFGRKGYSGLRGSFEGGSFRIVKFPIFKTAIVVGIIEAIILPILNYGIYYPFIANVYVQYAVIGLIAGFIAPYLLFSLYNYIGKNNDLLVMDINFSK